MRFRLAIALLVASICIPAAVRAQAPNPPIREITQIKDNVYRFRNNFHFSVFAVTPVGIIATDPINADAAKWLKAELAKRFNVPVKFVVYSHDHSDHSSGGEVFADTATIVAHENAKKVIIGEKRPTAVPQVTYSDAMTIELGGTVVELIYVGKNHSDNMTVMRFPAERVLYAVDFIPVKTVAFRDFPDAYLDEWIESIRRVELMDFDILVPGHGQIGAKSDATDHRVYLETLRAEVLKLAREGKSLDEIKQMVKLPQYASWGGYKQMYELNVEGMYRMVQANRRGN
jgi:glyoxylase-like metal-dependent hydrolase (beta-lactamase superfamily II)